ncbi:hypothetical protein ACFLQK_01140 [bacterium]
MEKKKNGTSVLAVLALLVFTGIVSYVKIWDQDTWWHLKAGQVIVSSSTLPREDSFSHTKNGEEWINDEWLGDYLLFSIFKKHGISGLQALVCVFSVFIAFILYQTALRLGANGLISAPLIAAAVLAARVRLTTRPELFSILFICSFFFLINRILTYDEMKSKEERQPPGKPRLRIEFFMIPVFQVMWVNIHPGAPFAFALLFCAIAAAAAAFVIRKKPDSGIHPAISASTMRALGLTFVLTILFTAVNPYGIHGITGPLEFAGNNAFLKHIAEWAPIPWREMFSLHGPPGHLAITFFLIVGIAAFAVGFRSGRINIFHILIFALTAYMALRSQRFIATFSLLAAPVAAAYLTPVFGKIIEKPPIKISFTVILIVALGFAGYAFGPRSPRFIWGRGINERFYPDRAIDFIRSNDFAGNMYNTYALGGPLIWGLYPEHRVFADGRVPLYGNDFYMDIIDFEGNPSVERWNEMQERFGLTFAVIKRERIATADAILKGAGSWSLVFWDSFVMIFAKNIPEHEKTIEENGYIMISPYSALDAARRWEQLSESEKKLLIAELGRNVEQNPRSIQAILSLAFISFIEHDHERAMKMALHGIEIDPRQARLHGLLGEIYLLQNRKKLAISEFRKASKLLPDVELYKTRIRDIAGK